MTSAPCDAPCDALSIALSLIRRFEGLRLAPYRDPGPSGLWTIGWGFTTWLGHPVGPATPEITREAADEELAARALRVLGQVRGLVPEGLSANELGALVSLTWNIGIGAFARSTLLRRLREGDRTAASEQFMSWVYSGGVVLEGLVARRAAERATFDMPEVPTGPDSTTNQETADVPVNQFDAPGIA